MTNEEQLESLAEELRQKRAALLKNVAETEEYLQDFVQERGSELEQRAQEDLLAGVLARLDDRRLQLIHEIDAALQRIAEGGYGKCERCGEPIGWARLRALPTTRACLDCVRAAERAGRERPARAAASQ